MSPSISPHRRERRRRAMPRAWPGKTETLLSSWLFLSNELNIAMRGDRDVRRSDRDTGGVAPFRQRNGAHDPRGCGRRDIDEHEPRLRRRADPRGEVIARVDIDGLHAGVDVREDSRMLEIGDGDHEESVEIGEEKRVAVERRFQRKAGRLRAAGREAIGRQAEESGARDRGADARGGQAEVRPEAMRGDERARAVAAEKDVGLAAAEIDRGALRAEYSTRVVRAQRHARRPAAHDHVPCAGRHAGERPDRDRHRRGGEPHIAEREDTEMSRRPRVEDEQKTIRRREIIDALAAARRRDACDRFLRRDVDHFEAAIGQRREGACSLDQNIRRLARAGDRIRRRVNGQGDPRPRDHRGDRNDESNSREPNPTHERKDRCAAVEKVSWTRAPAHHSGGTLPGGKPKLKRIAEYSGSVERSRWRIVSGGSTKALYWTGMSSRREAAKSVISGGSPSLKTMSRRRIRASFASPSARSARSVCSVGKTNANRPPGARMRAAALA